MVQWSAKGKVFKPPAKRRLMSLQKKEARSTAHPGPEKNRRQNGNKKHPRSRDTHERAASALKKENGYGSLAWRSTDDSRADPEETGGGGEEGKVRPGNSFQKGSLFEPRISS